MLVVVLWSIVLGVCRGFSLDRHRRIARGSSTLHFAPVDAYSLLFSDSMTVEDRKEIARLFAPATVPVVFITAFTTVFSLYIKGIKDTIIADKEATDKTIALNKESTDKTIAANKESTDKTIAANKESIEMLIASNKEIAEIQINALRDATDVQIKAFETKFETFEAKFDQLYNLLSRNNNKK